MSSACDVTKQGLTASAEVFDDVNAERFGHAPGRQRPGRLVDSGVGSTWRRDCTGYTGGLGTFRQWHDVGSARFRVRLATRANARPTITQIRTAHASSCPAGSLAAQSRDDRPGSRWWRSPRRRPHRCAQGVRAGRNTGRFHRGKQHGGSDWRHVCCRRTT